MLEARDISVFYGKHQALDCVSVSVGTGEIVVILGANGAGKSSFLKAVAGITPKASGGAVALDGRDLSSLPAHEIVEAGIALVPEGRGLFDDLTVAENLALGAYSARARAREGENLATVQSLFPKLSERRSQVVRTMSGGEQQMVAIGRAMMSAPTVLLLDEPSLGLSPLLCTELFRALAKIGETGISVLLVEQNARLSLEIATRAHVLDNGRLAASGTASELAADPAVRAAYLGG